MESCMRVGPLALAASGPLAHRGGRAPEGREGGESPADQVESESNETPLGNHCDADGFVDGELGGAAGGAGVAAGGLRAGGR